MDDLLQRFFGWVVTPPGLVVLAALDSSAVFFLPFALDGTVVFLAARDPDRFWLYPLLAAAGSIAGAVFSWWVGGRIDEHALERLVPKARLEQARERAEGGVWATAALAVVPPPFPYTGYIVAAGAFDLGRTRFLSAFAAARLVRFGLEAALARRYGREVLEALRSETARIVIAGVIAVALLGTAWAAWRIFRRG